MIDVGFWEVAMIGVLALIILGPERLPGVARTAGTWMGKARHMMREIKTDLKSELDEAELSELKNIRDDIRQAGDTFKSELESGEEKLRSEGSSMDTAIADALNKSTPYTPVPSDKKDSNIEENTSDKASKKETRKKKVAKKSTAKKATTAKKVADTTATNPETEKSS
jgi:sec-independent protein translocase protein TatB